MNEKKLANEIAQAIENTLGVEDTGDPLDTEPEDDFTADEGSPFWIGKPRAEGKIKTLLYGPSGSGKTRLASTFPKPVFLDFEGGMASITMPVGRLPKDPARKIDSWEQVREAFKILRSGKHPFETVVIDSLNEMQTLLTEHVVKNYAGIQKRNYQDLPAMADYAKIVTDVRRTVRNFLALPYHVVMICASKDREKDTDLVEPLLVGKLPKDVVRLFDLVGYMVVQEGENKRRTYNVSFSYSPQYVTKDRYDAFPDLIPADWRVMKQRIEGALNDQD